MIGRYKRASAFEQDATRVWKRWPGTARLDTHQLSRAQGSTESTSRLNLLMQENPKGTNVGSLPLQEIWDTVVRVTSRIDSDEAQALRIFLCILFSSGGADTLRSRLSCVRKLWRWMTVPPGRSVPQAPQGGPLITFILGTASNMAITLPVLQAAQKRSLSPLVLTADRVTINPRHLKGTGGLVNVVGLMAATTVRERWAALASVPRHYAALVAGFESEGPHWAGMVRGARVEILTELALFAAVRHGLRRLYARWKPCCVASTRDFWPIECAIFLEARRNNIPSFVIQHGVINRYWWPFLAHKLLLWGESFREEMLGLGAPAERLAVCGAPAMDSLFSHYQNGGPERNPQPASTYVILSGTHARGMYPEICTKYGTLLMAVLAKAPSVRWSIKLHPSENDSFYREIGAFAFPNFTILPKSTTLERAVTGADVACTTFSTAGLEAMIMRRPLVVFDVAALIYEYAWWPKHGGGVYIPTADAMVGFVKKASTDVQFLAGIVGAQDQFLRQTFAHPGRAAESVLDTMQDVLDAHHSTPRIFLNR